MLTSEDRRFLINRICSLNRRYFHPTDIIDLNGRRIQAENRPGYETAKRYVTVGLRELQCNGNWLLVRDLARAWRIEI